MRSLVSANSPVVSMSRKAVVSRNSAYIRHVSRFGTAREKYAESMSSSRSTHSATDALSVASRRADGKPLAG